jgi:hypothetical protein
MFQNVILNTVACIQIFLVALLEGSIETSLLEFALVLLFFIFMDGVYAAAFFIG